MTIGLRDYQIECVNTVLEEYGSGIHRQLLHLPTGSGKTIIMSALAKQLNRRTLLIAHREELIQQAYDKFKLLWPEADIGICMGDRNEFDHQIVVGSVQSCIRPKRLDVLKEKDFELLMIDEAHHSLADSYQNLIQALGFHSDKLLVGVTATPNDQGLDSIYQKITYSRSISTMIKAGYLSQVNGRKILTSFILDRIRTQNGDYAINELSEAVNTPERNDFIASKYHEYANDRKGITFCVDVQHCKDMSEAFNKQGIKCEAIYGSMDKQERKRILSDLKSGRIQVATSCGVLTEGFDEPSIECVVMARPTKSRSLYIQCVGRGLRLFPGKENCLVLDFTDRGHHLDSVMSLKTTIPEATCIEERSEKDCVLEEIDRTPKIAVSSFVDKEFDVLGSSRFMWIPIGDDEWSLLDDNKNEIVLRPEEEGYVADLYLPNGSSKLIVKTPLPLDYCSGVCEDFARRHLKVDYADVNASWMNQNSYPTRGQIEFLQKNKTYHPTMTKAKASMEIRRIIAFKNKKRRFFANEPITPQQRYTLMNYGYDTKNMNKLTAMSLISKIKQDEARYAVR